MSLNYPILHSTLKINAESLKVIWLKVKRRKGMLFIAQRDQADGVILDKNLDWKPHSNERCKKLSSAVYVVHKRKEISNDVQTAKTA